METLILLYFISTTLYFKEEISNLRDYTREIQEGVEKEGKEVKKEMSIAKGLAAVIAAVSAVIDVKVASYLKNPGFWIITFLCTAFNLCRTAGALKWLSADIIETFEKQRYFSMAEQIFLMGYYFMGVILALIKY